LQYIHKKIFVVLSGMDENDKRRIRKRTDIFEIIEGKLYYNEGKANKEKKLVITADQKPSMSCGKWMSLRYGKDILRVS
jgi:hypothetical protein